MDNLLGKYATGKLKGVDDCCQGIVIAANSERVMLLGNKGTYIVDPDITLLSDQPELAEEGTKIQLTQIEAMKCCGNCANYVPMIGQDQCAIAPNPERYEDIVTGNNKCETIVIMRKQLSDLREKLRWIPVTERLPDRDEKSRYSQVTCEVKKDSEVLILVFNHEHECWDDKEGDDFYCSIEEVSHWREIPELGVEG